MRSKNSLHFWLVALWAVCGTRSADAQFARKMYSYDKQLMHFGFLLGYNSGSFVAKNTQDFSQIDSVLAVNPSPTGGFQLGIVTDMRLGNYFDLRFIPTLTFAQRNLDYSIVDASTKKVYEVTKPVESTFIEFPLTLKLKSVRLSDYRFYVVTGVKYSIDLASRKEDVSSKKLKPFKIGRQDYGYEIGFGMDIYLEYIKFSPELKVYTGVSDMMVKDSGAFAISIDKLFSKILYLTITFE
jgi:hypothetical protein